MTLIRRIQDRLMQRSQASDDIQMTVTNATRQTLLARRMDLAHRGPKRRKGLLGRDRLLPGEGMWIVPCEAVHTFGMQFAIDLVYLNRRQRVIKVKSNVAPWRLSGCLVAHSVIELPAGTVATTRTSPGDLLEFYAASTKQE